MKPIFSAVLMAAAMALLVNCSSIRDPGYASGTDDRIESSARESYIFKTYLKDDDIEIHSQDGVVTVTGLVSDESHISLAQETVVSLPGVKSVDNRLEVKGTAPAVRSDAWLRDKVNFTLVSHQSVSAAQPEVEVKDGIVTLRGNATSQAQKDLATEYAKDVDGVKDVRNEMTVSMTGKTTPRTPGERIDDASITAQVKITLLFHRSTSALSTKVETKNGVVTVYGKASNAAEKDLVNKLVNDINGVKSVNNQMTIE